MLLLQAERLREERMACSVGLSCMPPPASGMAPPRDPGAPEDRPPADPAAAGVAAGLGAGVRLCRAFLTVLGRRL